MNKGSVTCAESRQSPRGIDDNNGLNRLKTMGAAVTGTDDFYNMMYNQKGEERKFTGNEIIEMNELAGMRD